jgi:hypothetical protein
MDECLINAAQVRMAKAVLGLNNPQLAVATGLHRSTLERAERGKSKAATFQHLKLWFESQGVVFAPNNGGPAGIRYVEPTKSETATDHLIDEGT